MAFQIVIGTKVKILVGDKYPGLEKGQKCEVTDRYISPHSGELLFEVVGGKNDYTVVRAADVVAL